MKSADVREKIESLKVDARGESLYVKAHAIQEYNSWF